MKQSTSLLLSAAALLPSIYAQAPQVVGTGVDPACEDVADVTVIEYPAYFSTIYESASTIFNFMGGTNSLVINNPPQTVITSTILTSTVTSTTTATVTGTPGAAATLGAGIPAGTVTSIPSGSPIVIAYIVDAVGGRRPQGFAGSDGTTTDSGDAEPFFLQDGELRTLSGARIGRNESDTYAAMVPSTDDNEVTGDFFFVDGELHWNSPDRGEAEFYDCDGNLYAGFPDAPFSNCTDATVGGISVEAIEEDPSTGGTSTTRGSTSSGSSSSNSSRTSSGSLTSGSSSSSSSASSSSSSSSTGSSSSGSSSSGSSTSGGSSSTSSGSSSTRSSTSMMSGSSTSTGTTSSGSSSTTSSGASSTTSAAASTAVCTRDDNTQVGDYNIFCGRGLQVLLGDLAVVELDSFAECIDECTARALCVGLSFNRDTNFCYLHSSLRVGFSNEGGPFDSAELANPPNPSTSSTTDGASTSSGAATTTSNGDATSTTTSAGTTTTTAAAAAVTNCPVENTGDDYFGYATGCNFVVDPVNPGSRLNGDAGEPVDTFDDCTFICDGNDDCVIFTYEQATSTCSIFSGAHQAPVARNGVISGFKSGSTGPGYPGVDSTTTSAGDEATTTSAGETTTSTSAGETTTTSAGDEAPTSSTTTTTTSTTTTTTSPPAATTTTPATGPLCPSTPKGEEREGFDIYCGYSTDTTNQGVDALTTVNNVATLEDCIDICTGECTGVTYNRVQKICYPHKGVSNPVLASTGDIDGAVKHVDQAAKLCGTTPYGTEVNGYQIYCGYNTDTTNAGGDDLGAVNDVPDLEGCITVCNGLSACTGVTYNSGPKICYPHKGTSGINQAAPEIQGAIKVGAVAPTDPTNPPAAKSAPPGCDALNDGTGNSCPTDAQLSADGKYYLYGTYGITGTNILTGDGKIAPAASFQVCQDRCTSVAECTSFSYQTIAPNDCFLHSGCYIGTNNDQNFSSGIKKPATCPAPP
ncbi:hypothetical protein PMZ80_005306 [Knufia obscura]|uniref:Apple domain-containing protein n=1 Tax=Knufia obscura TaxID=1635080 RepID=A0ABR0RR63_9EURO|nr:hypothetical protein PMZ80_005306 [Knufia obscura]